METPNLDAAFELLRRVVDDLEEAGRPVKAAGLKPTLQRLSYGAFSERELGFTTFREFLMAAKARGLVDIAETPGTDLTVTTGGAPAPTPSRAAKRPFVRRDLWRAFNDRTDGWRRVLRLTTGDVHMFPAAPGPLGDKSPEFAAFRTEVQTSPAAFLEIEPILETTEVSWMREFAQGVNDPPRAALLGALDTSRPTSAFAALISGLPSERDAWKAVRTQHVAQAIRDWVTAHRLEHVEIFERSRVVAPVRSARLDLAGQDDQAMRERIIRVLERLPLSELLDLRVPLQYALDD